jgi:hypothetical protein
MRTTTRQLRRCWTAVPRSAQNAFLTVAVLTGSLTILWALSPLWQHPTH